MVGACNLVFCGPFQTQQIQRHVGMAENLRESILVTAHLFAFWLTMIQGNPVYERVYKMLSKFQIHLYSKCFLTPLIADLNV